MPETKPPIRPRTRPLLFGPPTAASEPKSVRALKSFSSRQVGDPFANAYGAPVGGGRTILAPIHNPATLLRLPLESSALGPCIDAMVCNVVGHGWRLEYVGPRGEEASAEAQAEKTALENLLDVPNGDTSLRETLERVQRDRELLGAGYFEIGRNGKGEVVMLAHVPAHTLRVTTRDAEPVEIETRVVRAGKLLPLKTRRRFRRFVQLVGKRRVFFKEFGDPRRIDPDTGDENPTLSLEQSATEIMAFGLYAPGYVYPLPRWLGQLAAILGGRQAEMTNLDFFVSNAMPAMALLVSGGTVTEDTLTELDNAFTASRGRASQNRIAIIEVAGEDDPADPGRTSVPRVELAPLHGKRQTDALFSKYEEAAGQKVRGAFRLAPIFTGHALEHTYHSAQTSFEVAESQVFGPERRKLEATLAKILATLGTRFWAFKLNPAKITDHASFGKLLESADAVGAMTPNAAIAIVNAHLRQKIKPRAEAWANFPMQFSQILLKAGRLKGLDAITEKPTPAQKGAAAVGVVRDAVPEAK